MKERFYMAEKNKTFTLAKHDSDSELEKKWFGVKSNYTQAKRSLIKEINSFLNEKNMNKNDFCKYIDLTNKDYKRLMDETEDISLMVMAQVSVFIGYNFEITFNKIK
ncbi:hypothetical protein [Silvanigrella aquatica]|uniref:HTH cro/C1-type domain-containing protein n=1 Tax=Silvanigrella aquatica TaxID=1915309 RepID=A0A1L4D108_9BACT|nr:hypothetical protein [Silvanigrella aquatica]APJ03881.1 hypothetical protein AXG55_08160 [Silvanigrella aquatica]